MSELEQTPLTDKTLARLRALANGNGINPDSIQLIESKEKVYTLIGTLTLTPQCDIKTSQTLGRIKGKGIKVHASFAELQSEIASIQKSFREDTGWLDQAMDELQRTKGHGWGQEQAHLSWSDKQIILAASENCPVCKGTAQHPCHDCKGLSTIFCHYCEGRGQELCIQCAGTGIHPQDPKTKCPMCHGTRFSLCRFCNGTGKLPCVSCQGRGNTPCASCKGSGFISQEAVVNKGARLDFSHGSSSGLPSGLLRMISRIGDDKLYRGHADISIVKGEPEKKKGVDFVVIKLEAKIPYADIKLRIGRKAGLIVCFGKQGKLSGVPAFLDDSLVEGRKTLAAAATGNATVYEAQKFRALSDALHITLSGKTHPNELRRLYPVGLSAEAAKEIMENVRLMLKHETGRLRRGAASMCFVGFSSLFAVYFMTPTFAPLLEKLSPTGLLITKVALPVLALAMTWAILLTTARSSLKHRYPKATISPSQDIGKTGYITMALIMVAYFAIMFVSGMQG